MARRTSRPGTLGKCKARSEEIIQRLLAIVDNHHFVGRVAPFKGSPRQFNIAGVVFDEEDCFVRQLVTPV